MYLFILVSLKKLRFCWLLAIYIHNITIIFRLYEAIL